MTSSLPIAIINVRFVPCPFGFQPSGNPQKCDCAQGIPGVWCDIDTITVHHPAAVWIGNNSNSHISHSNCPLDYCKPEDSNLSLWNQNDQCTRVQLLCCSVWSLPTRNQPCSWNLSVSAVLQQLPPSPHFICTGYDHFRM